ncbi:MAG: hypothetical protein NT166_22120 [Candidatus Aminicenantes bacterium]|nr:hypothetical protein [Candidatus Aminicenantes bacterium]
MSKLFEAIFEFQKDSREPIFIEEQKKVASAINASLSQNYLDDGNEIDLVKGTIAALNKTPGSRFKQESLFIHGNRSQVQFDYYGKTAKKEMADLILVSTMTYRSKPVLQKMTIVQAKKDTEKMKASWAIDSEQLHFLSTWPVFTGVKGIFPKKEKNVVIDNSGCMGSYLLYREPGDFVFIAAPSLGRFLGGKKRVNINELTFLQPPTSQINGTNSFGNQYPFPFPDTDPDEWFYMWEKYMHRYYKMGLPMPFLPNNAGFSVLGNQLIALNVNDTVHHLSLLNIGELIFSSQADIGVNENAYRLLKTVLRYIRELHPNEIGELALFRYMREDVPIFEGVDMRGISVGLVHTISEIGQG